MRILHLEASPGWGGQEMRILREAEGMRARGHEVIFGVMQGALLGERARSKGFLVYELNYRRYAWGSTLFRLLYLILKHRIAIVNTHSSLDSWIGGIAARLAGRKIIRTRHFSSAGRPGLNSKVLYGKLADFVVPVCSVVIPALSEQSGKSKELFRSLPTGIDAGQIDAGVKEDPNFRQKLGVAENVFLVGTACFMRSWKGLEDFLKAADSLRTVADLRWVIIGGGHADRYRKLVQEMKLEEIVFFTGHLENPCPAIAALDAFALLSTANEGVAQAAQQAAYLKKPLITTPIGGLSEICLHEVTGIQVPPFDGSAVAAAVIRLKGDEALRARLGEKGREVVLEQFTFKHTLDGMEEIYRQLV